MLDDPSRAAVLLPVLQTPLRIERFLSPPMRWISSAWTLQQCSSRKVLECIAHPQTKIAPRLLCS